MVVLAQRDEVYRAGQTTLVVFHHVVHLAGGGWHATTWVAAASIAAGHGAAHRRCGGVACDFVVGYGVHVVVLGCFTGEGVGSGAKQGGHASAGSRRHEQRGVGNIAGAVAIQRHGGVRFTQQELHDGVAKRNSGLFRVLVHVRIDFHGSSGVGIEVKLVGIVAIAAVQRNIVDFVIFPSRILVLLLPNRRIMRFDFAVNAVSDAAFRRHLLRRFGRREVVNQHVIDNGEQVCVDVTGFSHCAVNCDPPIHVNMPHRGR